MEVTPFASLETISGFLEFCQFANLAMFDEVRDLEATFTSLFSSLDSLKEKVEFWERLEI